MSIAQEKLAEIRTQVQSHLDRRQTGALSEARRAALESTIRGHLKAHNAVIVAHYYTAPEIQALAEATGAVCQIHWRWRVLAAITLRKH